MVAEPIAVVGMAGVFPGAPDLATFWDNLVGGVDAVTDVPPDRVDPVFFAQDGAEPDRPGRKAPRSGDPAPDRFYCRRGGFIDTAVPFEPSEFGIMPVAAAAAEPDQLLALATAARALADAGYVEGVPERDRVGVVVGRGGYLTPAMARLDQRVRTAHQLVACVRELVPDVTGEQLDAIRTRFQDALGPSHPEASIGVVPNLVASRIANRLDLHGPAYTIDAACASSLLAVSHAAAELDAGRSDLMLAGGVHHCHDVTLWSVFSQLEALSASGVIRPFDARADGIVIGEGTGIVVLKRLSDARRAGDRIYATVRGTGSSSDGRAATLMSPASAGQVLAIERAWQAAGLDPVTVDLVEAHGSATPVGDSTEIGTLRRVFEPGGETLAPAGLGTVKSNIGHAMPASGIAGFIKSALALHHGVVPPTLHCDEPHPDLAPSRFEVVTEPRPWPAGGTPRRVGVNAFGFGGINAHVILEGEPPERTAVPHVAGGPGATPGPSAGPSTGQSTRLFVASGDGPESVAAQLADDEAVLAGSDLTALDAEGPVRLVIADPTPKRLALARKVVARGQAWRGRNDVWFSPDGLIRSGGKVAFAFPGIEPDADTDLADVARHFGLGAGDPKTHDRTGTPDRVPRQAAPPRDRRPDSPLAASSPLEFAGGVLRDCVLASDESDSPISSPEQPAGALARQGATIVEAGRLLTDALAELRVRPDVVVGHSLGEWTALLVAGVVTREAVDRFVGSLAGGDVVLPDLVFLAAGCGVDVAEAAIDGLPDIAVSHDNCPHQVIVCGSEASVAVARERLKSLRVLGQVLPYRTGFHTPMFADHLAPIEAAFRGLPVHPPALPLYSSVAVTRFPDDEAAIRDLGRRLYVERVRFRQLVETLYDDGVRVFVQPGTGSVVGFVGDTLHGREHLAVAGVAPKRSALAQLARAAAALFVEGADVPLGRLVPAGVPAPAGPARRRRADGPARTDGSSSPVSLAPGDGASVGRPPPAPGRSAVLRFDAPLVRGLAPLARPAVAGPREVELPASVAGPVADEFWAAMQAVSAAGREVVDALAATSAAPVAVPSASPMSAPAASATAAAREHRMRRRLSVADVPELADHAFYAQPEGTGTLADRFPVVPMTMMIQIFADTATELGGGRVVVGLQNVRALRWLAVEPPVEVDVTATWQASDRVKVAIEGYARATVVLADHYPDPPPPDTAPLRDEGPALHTAARMYADRWMFHGPAYQGVTGLDTVAADGARATLTCLPSPGALLDAAGQVLGYWIECTVPDNRVALPMRIDGIDIYGPHPEPGAQLDCTLRITDLNDTDARSDIDLVRNGRLWARLRQWVDRRFEAPGRVFDVMQRPDRLILSERRDGFWIVRDEWPSSASRDLLARCYLDQVERDRYFSLDPRAQRDWLVGRIAVKDAVRDVLWRAGAGPLFPQEVPVRNDDAGRPHVTLPDGSTFAVSLAHRAGVGVATVARDGGDADQPGTGDVGVGDVAIGDVGIDVELVESRSERFASMVMTEGERALGAGLAPDVWAARAWTAKEAAAKADGTGLRGRPGDFTIRAVTGAWSLVNERWVHTTQEGDLIVSTVRQR